MTTRRTSTRLADGRDRATTWVEPWSDDVGADRVRRAFAATYEGRRSADDETQSGTSRGATSTNATGVRVYAAPGRVNVIGEHTDYNGGLCLPIALPHRTYVALRPRTDLVVRIASAQEAGAAWTGRLEDVAQGTVDGWAGYVAGVAWALREHLEATGGSASRVRGFDAVVDSCVPSGAGLSSSAALECAVAVGLDDVTGLGLARTDGGRATLATAAVRAENEIAGAPTGGMDQAASLRCTRGHALLLDCRPGLDPVDAVEQVPFDLAAEGLALLVIDTRAEHALVDGQYAQRRATCEAAATTLGLANLRELADAVAAQAEHTTSGDPADRADYPASSTGRTSHPGHATAARQAGLTAGSAPAGRGASTRRPVTSDHDSHTGRDRAGASSQALAAALDRLPDDVARRRVRHVVTEIARTQDLVALLRAGRASDVGPLLDASHASLRDDYDVSSPELDLAVEAARAAGALGARMTGGGFGGSAIALVGADRAHDVADAVAGAFARAGLGAPGFLLGVPSAPAGAC
jgi:UDPglucose--hexose-1-phosphate uridylyltransferase